MANQTNDSGPETMSDDDRANDNPLSVDETLDLLFALLHAERAGAQVCVLSRRDAPSLQHQQLLRDIHRDEIKSCKGLINSLHILGAEPDKVVGDFVEKCLAIENFHARLQFLNRGQGWVARKITDALPRIPQEEVQHQLATMLEEHRSNIDRVNAFLTQHPAPQRPT